MIYCCIYSKKTSCLMATRTPVFTHSPVEVGTRSWILMIWPRGLDAPHPNDAWEGDFWTINKVCSDEPGGLFRPGAGTKHRGEQGWGDVWFTRSMLWNKKKTQPTIITMAKMSKMSIYIYTYICEIMWYVDVDVYMFCDVWYEPLEPLESRNRLATWMT